MTKKKECKAEVLAILDAPNLELIAAALTCHRTWKSKKNVGKKLFADADDNKIEAKSAATKKKAAEKRKAPSELRRVAALAMTAAAMASGAVDQSD
jgi:hypothetical protein